MRKKFDPNIALEIAEFGGGCFWDMQRILNVIPGVLVTTAGFNGGTDLDPKNQSDSGALRDAGYVEVVKVEFDPTQVTFSELLRAFRTHILNHDSSEPLERVAVFPHSDDQARQCSDLRVLDPTYFIEAPADQQDYLYQ